MAVFVSYYRLHMSLASIVAASLVPFDLTIVVTAVASVALALFVGFFAFLALAPVVSEKWTEQLDATAARRGSLEANEAD